MKFHQILPMVFMLFLISCEDDMMDTNMSEEVANFEFTTQDDKLLSLEDLSGEWWITNFMYTNCTQVCPTMTPNLVHVQNELKNLDLDVQIVSFSIDPNYDTPDVLKKYAENYQADLSNWTFFTGYDFSEIKELSEGSFKTALNKGSPGEVQFAHSTSFFLVNPDGKIVKKYDGMVPEEMDVIIKDLKKVS